MKQPVADQTKKKTTLLPTSGLLPHAAIRAVPDHAVPPLSDTRTPLEPRSGHDLSRVPVHTADSCPVFPRRCPFGGACHTCPARVQTKLKIGQPGDKYEQEADRVADQVMRMSEPTVRKQDQDIRIQRACAECDDELRRQPIDEIDEEEEEELIQAKLADSTQLQGQEASSSAVPPIVSEVLRSPGQPLDPTTRAFMEPRFGHDLSRVRVHTDRKAAESARAVNALAYTVGSDVVFRSGRYAPEISEGRRLIAHELTHVVQQPSRASGLQTALTVNTRGDVAEQEAESVAGQVAAGSRVPAIRHTMNADQIGRTPDDRSPARPSSGLRLDVVGSDAPPTDANVRAAARSLGVRNDLTVDSLEQLIDRLEERTAGGQCVQELTIWNHGRPGQQRIAGRAEHPREGRVLPYSGFTLNWLANRFNQANLNRLRRVFCCGARMRWLGCATAGVAAPERVRSQAEMQRDPFRYRTHGDVYQDVVDLAEHGADELSATFGQINVLAWASATCTTITAATDFVLIDPGNERQLYHVTRGGRWVSIPPAQAAGCACTPGAERPSGTAPSATLLQTCSSADLDRVRTAAVLAHQLARTAVLGLQELIQIWGQTPSTAQQRAASHALARAFNIAFDKTLWVDLGMNPAEVQAQDASDRAAAATILANFQQIEADLPNYFSPTSCPNQMVAGTPCVGCVPPQHPRCPAERHAFVPPNFIGSPSSAVLVCPIFLHLGDFNRAEVFMHEIAHLQSFAASDIVGGTRYYGCPIRPEGLGPGLREPAEFIRIADSYRCFVKTQHEYTGGSSLALRPHRTARPLPVDALNIWAINVLLLGDTEGAFRVIVQAMEQRGDIDTRLMATQANLSRPGCANTQAYLLGTSVRGASTNFCGCFGSRGNRLPNPRIRVHPDLVSQTSLGFNRPQQIGAETLHSILLHEFRHVRQEYERCNSPRAQTGGGGICTDCNSPDEMDAYLSEIEAGYAAEPIRHAWVRVYVNWDYLSERQQAVFATRREAAERKLAHYYPGVNWAADSEVRLYQAWCQRLAGGPRGTCDSSLAPLGP